MAPQPQAGWLWHRRSSHASQLPHPDFTGLMSFSGPSRVTNSTATSRPYQTSHVHLSVPMYPSAGMNNSIPMQSNSFGFGTMTTTQPSISTPYRSAFAPLNHVATFPGGVGSIPAIQQPQNLRNGYSSTERSPMVKSETEAPAQAHQMFYAANAAESAKLPSPAVSDKEIDFSTDVDTLMKAIQSKSTSSVPQGQQKQQIQQPMPAQKVSFSRFPSDR